MKTISAGCISHVLAVGKGRGLWWRIFDAAIVSQRSRGILSFPIDGACLHVISPVFIPFAVRLVALAPVITSEQVRHSNEQ